MKADSGTNPLPFIKIMNTTCLWQACQINCEPDKLALLVCGSNHRKKKPAYFSQALILLIIFIYRTFLKNASLNP